MQPCEPLIGREEQRAALDRAVAAARDGRGGLVLVTGEAGVGKTALVKAVLRESGLLPLVGTPPAPSSEPYGPIVALFRAFLRAAPHGLDATEPLAAHLNILLPELGPPPERSDLPTLYEAVRRGFVRIAAHRPTLVFLEDLHWADEAAIDLLNAVAAGLEQLPLLVIGAYRSDELSRSHPLRRLRLELRRAGRLRELSLEPLDRAGTARLAERTLGQPPSPALQAILHDRTQGLPFFVEELAGALVAGGRLHANPDGLTLDPSATLPIPESVRDAVLLRTGDVTASAGAAQQVAAVAGHRFALDLVAELAGGADGLDELIDRQIVVEAEPGVGAFRHALVREAVYEDIPWGRRRELHRQMATRLEARGGPPSAIAEHWSAAQEPARARRALIAAADASCVLHAYRDAVRSANRALALWPEDDAPIGRLEFLERLGQCVELSGDLTAGVRVWREAADGWRRLGERHRAANAERRLATVHELQSAWQQAIAARLAAADGFAAVGQPGDAAAERLAVAHHLRISASYTAALPLLELVRAEAEAAGRLDLTARAMGHEGNVRARLGQYEAGLALARDGLALALEHNLSGPAVEIYQRLGDSLSHAGQYDQAREMYQTASDFCRTRGESIRAEFCMACMSVVLWQTGEWDQTIQICRDVLATEGAYWATRMAAAGMLGAIHAFRGDPARARPFVLQSATIARPAEVVYIELLNEWVSAYVEHLEGNDHAAAGHCRTLLARWERTEERHYAVSPLRWATTFFAGQGAASETRACASALSRIAAGSANVEALAGLAHALGETLLLDNEAAQAARQFEHALELLRDTPVPFDVAQTHLRAGVAHAAAGQRQPAVAHLTDAYRIARTLEARPLAAQAARELAALGEPTERRPGRKDGGTPNDAGLSQRQIEVLKHIALGRTDREIAQVLFLSPRTVEMHVANCLAKLNCRSRAEAIHRANELGVLGSWRG
jgi:DNA-binding NarL/FixJ family response regulator